MNSVSLKQIIEHIEGWLSPNEGVLLYTLARRIHVEGEIVEIGSWKGKSTICLAYGIKESHKTRQVWAIDPHEGIINIPDKKTFPPTYKEFLTNIARQKLQSFVQSIVKTSISAEKTWRKPIALLFLDGLHDYAHVKEDYNAWSKHVVDNGIIAFHDGFCGEEGVWRVIQEYCFSSDSLRDMGTVGSIFYIIKGTPTVVDQGKIFIKKHIVYISYSIHTLPLPRILKLLIIHKILRLFLLTPYTRAVYTMS